MFVNFNILNQLGSPAINSNTFANRPAAGQTGRLFVSTDTYEIYRDNGTTWDLIGGPGSSTITGTGTATQVAYFTSSQAIGSSANLFWDNTNTRLGIGTATPGAALDIHSTGIMAQLNSTSATANSLLAFQRSGSGLWRIGDNYGSGTNYFELFNTVLGINAMQVFAANNKTSWQATETYTTGLARGNYFDYNLSVAAGGSFSSPNAITALTATLDLTLAGNATIPSGARSGLDAYNSIAFTGAGTLTHTQGTQIRAYSNLTAGWAFNGSAVGTITHLAGLRALFPDNSGSAVNVTNNYALLLNDQTANTGTVTYTNRWGVYQEGASDTNYFNATTLIGTTVNAGFKLDVNGAINSRDIIYIGGGSNATYGIEIGYGRSTTGSSYVDLIGGDLTYTDYGARFVRESGGANANSGIFHRGTGLLKISAQEAAPITFETNSIERMRITSGGNVGIGTTSPAQLLSVEGSTTEVLSVGTSAQKLYFRPDSGGVMLSTATGQAGEGIYFGNSSDFMYFQTASTERMRITSGGNLLIGTTTDAGYKLDVTGGNSFFRGGTVFQGAAGPASDSIGQRIVGTSTAAASTVSKKIIYCDHTNSITVKVIAYQDTANNASITADFCTSYGANNIGNNFSSAVGNVTAISLAYNNGGSPAYTIDCTVTYTGTAPTLYILVEGIGRSNMYII